MPQPQYFQGLWHSFFFSTVKDGIIALFPEDATPKNSPYKRRAEPYGPAKNEKESNLCKKDKSFCLIMSIDSGCDDFVAKI